MPVADRDRPGRIAVQIKKAKRRNDFMDDLTQTISNLVGILLGLVGVVGVGYFICAPRHVA